MVSAIQERPMEFLKRSIRAALPEKVLAPVRDAKDALFRTRRYYERSERQDLMRKSFCALSFNGISGDYLEFGSWGGVNFTLAYQESRRAGIRLKLWSFDSFQGLPPQTGLEGGMSTSLEKFRALCRQSGISDDDYTTVPGDYEDTIAHEDRIGLPLPTDVAMSYINSDLYSSTKIVLQFLSTRMKHGMIVALDDYFCYSASTLSGQRRACLEFLQNDARFHFSPFVQFGWHGMSFIVEDRAMHPSSDPGIL
jgi:O-methyltransferase